MTKRLSSIAAFIAISSTCLGWTTAGFALPPERHYEMVSPPYKAGYAVAPVIEAVAPDGQSVAFLSQGTFDGELTGTAANMYLAHRTTSGWSTGPLEPPSSLLPMVAGGLESNVRDFSPSLQLAIADGKRAPNAQLASYVSSEEVFLSHEVQLPNTPDSWPQLGPTLEGQSKQDQPENEYDSASPDFCHVISSGLQAPLLAQAVGVANPLYDLSACGETPGLSVVDLNNKGKAIAPLCPPFLGGFRQGPVLNAVADAGNEVFFSAYTNLNAPRSACSSQVVTGEDPAQVFVRLGGSKTIEVSRPLNPLVKFGGCGPSGEVPCPGAAERAPSLFQGADEAGSRVFFTTAEPLVASTDTDNSEDLYMADIGCPTAGPPECAVSERQVTSLVQVSRARAGEAAEVQGVLGIARDASRVYFVARGVLNEASGPEDLHALPGADNLYVYDALTGATSFIADLCSGSSVSGSVEDVHCPRDLGWEDLATHGNDSRLWIDFNGLQGGELGVRQAQLGGPSTDPGRFLVFSSYGRLIARGAQADIDDARDIYRYDAVTGALDRVSLGVSGYDANGNCEDGSAGDACDALLPVPLMPPSHLASQYHLNDRAISEDGSRVVFSTAEPLASVASNGLRNVYEWHLAPGTSYGEVSLISTGSSPTSDAAPVISATGSDILFVTSQGLESKDTDGVYDVYDARVGALGESGQPFVQTERCSGEACYGPLTNPAPLLVPGSVPQAPGGNFAAFKARKSKVKGRKSKRGKHRKRDKHARRHSHRSRVSTAAGNSRARRNGR